MAGPEGAVAGAEFGFAGPAGAPSGRSPEVGSDEPDAGMAVPSASPLFSAQNKAIKQTAIQMDAVMIVIRVNTSPAFAPNALEPPMPPSAPANPPPRPRCTSTSKIKKIANRDKTMAKNALIFNSI
jgi:hypothetical protein